MRAYAYLAYTTLVNWSLDTNALKLNNSTYTGAGRSPNEIIHESKTRHLETSRLDSIRFNNMTEQTGRASFAKKV